MPNSSETVVELSEAAYHLLAVVARSDSGTYQFFADAIPIALVELTLKRFVFLISNRAYITGSGVAVVESKPVERDGSVVRLRVARSVLLPTE